MNSFDEIIAALGGGNGPWDIGDDPPLRVFLNPGTRSLVFVLNAGVHMTLYESSWDDEAEIRDCTGDDVEVGPHCLHTTAGQERGFRQCEGGNWTWVTDCGTPTHRYLLAFDAMMNTMATYLFKAESVS